MIWPFLQGASGLFLLGAGYAAWRLARYTRRPKGGLAVCGGLVLLSLHQFATLWTTLQGEVHNHPRADLVIFALSLLMAAGLLRMAPDVAKLRRAGDKRDADLSDVEHEKQTLATEQKVLREIIDLVPHFIFVKTRDGRMPLVNKALADGFGSSVAEIESAKHEDIHPVEDELNAMRRDDIEVIDSGKPKFIVEENFTDSEGIVHILQTIKIPLEYKGEKCLLGVAVDNTEIKKLEDQLRHSQKMEALGQLAGGVAHDFNNHLTIIMGYAEGLIMDLKSGSFEKESAEQILEAGRMSAALTAQLLAFSRSQVLNPKPLDINELVRHFQKMMGRLVGEGVELNLDLVKNLRPVLADAAQIEQVLMNLLVNGRDAMPKGGSITIRTANRDPVSGISKGVLSVPHIELSVTDSGAGIPVDEYDRIFEPFYTTKAKGKGTGLGLSTVLGIVQQSGGDILLDTELDVGSSFRVVLPAHDAKKEELDRSFTDREFDLPPEVAVDSSSASEATQNQFNATTVLVVEDEPMLRTLAIRILEDKGYSVIDAEDGLAGLEAFISADPKFDLILSDVVMPRMGGGEFARKVLEIRPGQPILFMSGYLGDHFADNELPVNEQEVLRKPFTSQALLDAIEDKLVH